MRCEATASFTSIIECKLIEYKHSRLANFIIVSSRTMRSYAVELIHRPYGLNLSEFAEYFIEITRIVLMLELKWR